MRWCGLLPWGLGHSATVRCSSLATAGGHVYACTYVAATTISACTPVLCVCVWGGGGMLACIHHTVWGFYQFKWVAFLLTGHSHMYGDVTAVLLPWQWLKKYPAYCTVSIATISSITHRESQSFNITWLSHDLIVLSLVALSFKWGIQWCLWPGVRWWGPVVPLPFYLTCTQNKDCKCVECMHCTQVYIADT